MDDLRFRLVGVSDTSCTLILRAVCDKLGIHPSLSQVEPAPAKVSSDIAIHARRDDYYIVDSSYYEKLSGGKLSGIRETDLKAATKVQFLFDKNLCFMYSGKDQFYTLLSNRLGVTLDAEAENTLHLKHIEGVSAVVEPKKTEVTQSEPEKAEVAPVEPEKVKVTQSESEKAEVAPVEPEKVKVAQPKSEKAKVAPVEPEKVEVAPVEPEKAKVTPVEPVKAKVTQSESGKAEAAPSVMSASESSDLVERLHLSECEVSNLKAQLSLCDLDANKKLNEENRSLRAELEHLKSSAIDKTALNAANDKLMAKISDCEKLQSDLDSLKQKVDTVSTELSSLEVQNTSLVSAKSDLEKQLDLVSKSSSDTSNLNAELQKTIDTLKSDKQSLADQLSASDIKYNELLKDRNLLESKVSGYATLSESKDALTKTVADLNNQIADIKTKLSDKDTALRASQVNAGKLMQDMSVLKLDTDRLHKDNATLNSSLSAFRKLTSSYVGSLACNYSNPDTVRPVPSPRMQLIEGVTTFCAGSMESLQEMYSNLKKSCAAFAADGGVVLLDLSRETYIDREFQLSVSVSCKNFIWGGGPASEGLMPTCIDGVSAMSLGLTYLNDIALLSVDWVSVIQRLKAVAKHVVISLGVLSNTLADALFGIFKDMGPSHIYALGSPISLRSACLNLLGGDYTSTNLHLCKFAKEGSALNSLFSRLSSLCRVDTSDSVAPLV